MVRRVFLTLLAGSLTGSLAFADPPVGENGLELPAEMIKMAMAGKAPGGEEKPPYPPFEEVTKGMEATKGLFTLWSYPNDAKDKDKEKLLCQLPSSFLGEKFMLSISISGGGFFTGFPWEERVVQWEVLDRQLILVEPETHYVIQDGKPVSDVVKRTYPERIRAALPILTKSASGDPVIDLGDLLKSNFADIAWMSGADAPFMFLRGGGGVNPALSKWTKKKSFELNVELGVELAVNRMSPPGSYDKKLVHYSFWKLPKTDYQPRIADDRVGYFLTANQDWSKPADSRDIFNRYIDRWHLEKRDSSLEKCEPKQPIIYYIEKTVPVKYRAAIRDGILEWNRAYEKVGFLNAVEVRQQTDDNEWKNLDPEDMRYSFFRWIVTGAGFAMGPHRGNPFTGQIYDADIIFDDSMVRYYEQDAATNLGAEAMKRKMRDSAVEEFLNRFPQFARYDRPWEVKTIGEEPSHDFEQAMRERMRRRGYVACDYAEGMKHQLSVAHAMLAEAPRDVVDKMIYDVIKEIVMHEVGHTLGLRHNFKASTIYTLDQLAQKRAAGEALVGSVMDYNPVLFVKDKPLEGHFITPTIGPYDYWAIEYGYRPADGSFKGKTETEEGKKGDEKPAEQVTKAADKTEETPATPEIPKEILDKLPPEVRKMIESGGAAKMTQGAKPGAASGGPAFKGPAPGEEGMLKAIASRAAEPELAYASDEDTTLLAPDPRSNRFDMGADPMEWAKMRMDLVNKRLETMLDWAVKDEESWYHLRSAYLNLMFDKFNVIDYVGRYIGGQYTTRSHRGDANSKPPFELVDPKLQREALEFTAQHLYGDDFFRVSPEALNHMAASRWWHEGTSINMVVDFPIHELIAAFQWMNLFDRLFPNTLRRIYDAQLKTAAEDKLTAAEYLRRLQDAVWEDSIDASKPGKGKASDASPAISSIRRSLQREYLNMMEPLVRIQPGVLLSPDLHAMVQHSLRQLNERIGKSLSGGELDFASAAHLTSCQSRVERMLAPELREIGM